jgi:hypothetical protein
MQASLTSPYRAEIFTDQPIYEPGEQVTGRVIFTLRRKLQFDRLLATLRGEVRVKFEPKPDPKELLGYRRPTSTEKPILYENKRELINKTVELWSQKKAVGFFFD